MIEQAKQLERINVLLKKLVPAHGPWSSGELEDVRAKVFSELWIRHHVELDGVWENSPEDFSAAVERHIHEIVADLKRTANRQRRQNVSLEGSGLDLFTATAVSGNESYVRVRPQWEAQANAALKEVEDKHGGAVLLFHRHKGDGESIDAIATDMEMKPSKVKTAIHRVEVDFRRVLDRRVAQKRLAMSRNHPDELPPKLKKVALLHQSEEFAQMDEELLLIEASKPEIRTHPQFLHHKGISLLWHHRYPEEALQVLEEALKVADHATVRAAVLNSCAVASYMLGRLDDAERFLRRSTACDAKLAAPHMSLLAVACERRDQIMAAACLDAIGEFLRNPHVLNKKKYEVLASLVGDPEVAREVDGDFEWARNRRKLWQPRARWWLRQLKKIKLILRAGDST